jgi:hypothetical protein
MSMRRIATAGTPVRIRDIVFPRRPRPRTGGMIDSTGAKP